MTKSLTPAPIVVMGDEPDEDVERAIVSFARAAFAEGRKLGIENAMVDDPAAALDALPDDAKLCLRAGIRAAIAALSTPRDALVAAGRAMLDAIRDARNMVPDEEEGLAAQVFAYHINAAETALAAALTNTLTPKGDEHE